MGTEPEGTVADGFEGAAEAFGEAIRSGTELGAALSVYLDGRCVVDLWGGRSRPGVPWRRDTVVPLASATKGVVALAAQLLSERGLLDVEARVADYWPEFGCAGKDATRVRHVLEHTAGLLTFPRYWEVINPDGRQLADHHLMTSHLAAAPPSWPPGSRVQYTPLVFGYLAGELIRRVDGRTVGQFIAEEACGPLGLDLWIGLPACEAHRVAGVQAEDPAVHPRLTRLQERADQKARELVAKGCELDPDSAPYAGLFLHPSAEESRTRLAALLNDPYLRSAEIPGCNGISDARSMARLYAALARTAPGGDASTADGGFALGYMQLPMPTLAAPGALRVRPGPSVFGHSGAGGTLAFADPAHRLSFAYVKNRMLRLPNSTYDMVRSVYRCLSSLTT
ncbi:beta-lactamase family protein [Streptomyces canus]|uniref:serine hydrolase domain-containing protein n=1 Tax=Streptomyces canus TaxID=58343 RepID=UPI0030E44607